MPLRTSWAPPEGRDEPTPRRALDRQAKTRGIAATARILRPTHASLARATTKRLSGEAKAKAEARRLERKRRLVARVTKQNGKLTVPVSPQLRTRSRAKPSAREMLTMTSRELMEIAAIKARVQETRRKVQKYHEATTRSVLSTALSSSSSSSSGNSSSSSKTSFAVALRSCGGLGVPAVRRAKLTQPVGFEFEIDKRLDSRKRVASATASSSITTASSARKSTSRGGAPAQRSSETSDAVKVELPAAKRVRVSR